jgi:hypothetical protein
MKLVISAIVAASLCGCACTESYKEILELKYKAPLKRFEVVSFSPTTKILWFDWEPKWWGSLNVVETTKDEKILYWYDIPEEPTAQSIESIRVVTLSHGKYVEIIDCTHMGNGMLYLYEIRAGIVSLKLKVRVIAALSGIRFEPRIGRIEYRDINGDDREDVIISAKWVEEREDSDLVSGSYYREYHYRDGSFQEHKEKRTGRTELLDGQ